MLIRPYYEFHHQAEDLKLSKIFKEKSYFFESYQHWLFY